MKEYPQEKIQELKDYYGWDDEFVAKLTARDLYSAFKILKLEEEVRQCQVKR